MDDFLEYGRFKNELGVKAFLDISEKAEQISVEAIGSNLSVQLSDSGMMFNNLLYLAGKTSWSVRYLATSGLMLQAYMLLRIRFEQTLVSSYLVHEDREKGFIPFLKHNPSNEYHFAKSAKEDPRLNEFFSDFLDKEIDGLKKKAVEFEKHFNPAFNEDGFEPHWKWTNKSIFKIAEKRDELTEELNEISSFPLLVYYRVVYKAASSLVHADRTSISKNFITVSDESNHLVDQPIYLLLSTLYNAHLDIIQNYEVLKFLGIDKTEDYLSLYEDYQKEIRKAWDL